MRLNLSKSGPSLTFGGPFFHYTVGHGRRRTTVGVPGTGVYYTAVRSTRARRRQPRTAHAAQPRPRQSLTATVVQAPAVSIVIAFLLLVPCLALIAAAPAIGLGASAVPVFMLVLAWRTLARTETMDARLLSRVHRHPDQAETLLAQGIVQRPGDPTLLSALGDLRRSQDRWQDAATQYTAALGAAPQAWPLRAHLGECHLHLGQWQEAIAALQEVRQDPVLPEESRAVVTAHLALAFIGAGDAMQALELVKAEPLQRHTLDEGLQQCLYVRAVARYLLGQRAPAIHDLDRLYAVNASFPDLAEAKAEMTAGSFRPSYAGRVIGAEPQERK